MIILKNVSTSNPGLARIPMSFASSAITDYIRNLCLWRTKTQYAINAYPHVHHDFFALCVQGPHREAAWVNLDKVRRKTSLHLLPLQKPKWGQVVRFSENLTKNGKKCVKFRKPERDHESDWKSGAAQKVDQGSNASDGNFVFFNQISKIKHTLHFKWLDMLKCLWWWYAKAGHISAAALGCTVIVFTVFVTCSRRVQPSCSRWICSALRRNGSWQA